VEPVLTLIQMFSQQKHMTYRNLEIFHFSDSPGIRLSY
jgi:hypothetical protein